jgi:hypothetical protein
MSTIPSGATARDDLAHRLVELLLGAGFARRALGERCGHGLKESHIVPDLQGLLMRHRQRKGLRQVAHRLQKPLLAVHA